MALDLDERHRAMLMEMGVRVWAQPQPMVNTAPIATPKTKVELPPPQTASTESKPSDLAGLDWQSLVQTMGACQACGLCAGRTNAVLHAQPAAPVDWMVVGDPPDEEEDRAGHPFVGPSGILLDNMLKAVGVSRTGSGATGAYLSAAVKCRPPHGRVPQSEELAQCAGYLQREIALVQPKVILAMGRFAIQTLLAGQPDLAALPLGKLRGTVHRFQGIAVVVTYHPKVLLRAGADKGKAWADLCLAMDVVQD